MNPCFAILKNLLSCGGSPTISTATSTETSWGVCPNDWTIDVDATFSSTPSEFEVEWWRAVDSGGTSFAYWRRRTLTSPEATDTEGQFGSDGSGNPRTEYRKYKARIVPAASPNGAGPFCDDQETTPQISRTGGDCVE